MYSTPGLWWCGSFYGGDKDQFDAALKEQIDSKEMERFLTGRVFFTHFTSVTRSVEQSELEDFYERGVAILCKRNQAAVDMIIPVRLCQDDKSYIMSYILVQVQNYTYSDGNYKWASSEVRPDNAGLSGKPADYPYLALYLQLGYQTGKVDNLKYEKHDVAIHTAIPGARREASGSESVEDRFQMIIGLFSLKPAAYPCLRDEGKPYGPLDESKNSKHLSDFCRAWSDPLYYIESKEQTALGGREMQQAKSDFVKRTCVLTYASSSSGGAAAPVAEEAKVEKTSFDVKLEKFDARSKTKIIKEVRTFTALGRKKAKELAMAD